MIAQTRMTDSYSNEAVMRASMSLVAGITFCKRPIKPYNPVKVCPYGDDIRIVLEDVDNKSRKYIADLRKGDIIITRETLINAENQIEVSYDRCISKGHCRLYARNGKVFISDNGSTNGTFVNGMPVNDEREIKNEALLRLGRVRFKVTIEKTAVS